MNAGQNAKAKPATGSAEIYYKAVEAGRPVIVVTKIPWYKELAGVVGFFAWLVLIGLWAYALFMPDRTHFVEWWYLLALVAVATVCSAFRQQSAMISMEREG